MLRKFMISAFLLAPVTLAGCSSLPFADRFSDSDKKNRDEQKKLAAIAAQPEVPPKVLLNSGIRNVNDGNSKAAQKAFDELGKQHPFSNEAQRSLVLSAYTHFTDKEYEQTISKAQQFIQLYPGSADAAYMQYLIGESYYVRVGSVVLDQEDTSKGLQAYTDLVRLYPDSKYAEDAKSKMLFLADQLAGKEMQIGRYYQERRQHLAAVNRFKTVVDTHQTTRHIEEALYRLTESYLALGLVNDARSATSLLGHNYPDSEWYASAYDLIKGGKAKSRKDDSPKVAGLVPFIGKKKTDDDRETSPVAEDAVNSATGKGVVDASLASEQEKSGFAKITPFLGIPPKEESVSATEQPIPSAETDAISSDVAVAPAVEAAPVAPVVEAAPVESSVESGSVESAPAETVTEAVVQAEPVEKKKKSTFSKIAPFLGIRKEKDADG